MAVNPDRWGVIYNPRAGGKRARKRWTEIVEYMESQQVKFDYIQSEGFGSVERLTRTLANNGYQTIVVVGGEGAINDAVNGIMNSDVVDKSSIALGIIPNGLSNDFAKFWEIDTEDYKVAVDMIIKRRLRKIDVGVLKYHNENGLVIRYFVNAVYLGLVARIVRITHGTKRFWGIPLLSYLSSLFLLIWERKLYPMKLKINNETFQKKVMAIAIGSARGYGLTPSAVPYNGWLDVSIIYRPDVKDLISGLWLLHKGRLLNHRNVKAYRTKKVCIDEAKHTEVSLDGRILQEQYFPMKLYVNHEALTLIIPS